MGVLVRVLKSNVNVRREMPRRLGGRGRNGNTYIAFEGWAEPSSYSRRHPHLYNPKISFHICPTNFFFNLEDVPSNTPKRMAQPTADPNADLGPATLNFGQPTPREHRSIPRKN